MARLKKETEVTGAPEGAPSSSVTGLLDHLQKTSNAHVTRMTDGDSVITVPKFLSTGLPTIDHMLGGGIPAGRITELFSKGEGMGKCLKVGTPVLMADGTIRPVEAVNIGDSVMGPDGWAREVIDRDEGEAELYRVTPSRSFANEFFVVTGNHRLVTRRLYHGEWLEETPTVIEFMAYNSWRARHTAGFKNSSPLVFDTDYCGHSEVPAYFLGLWLGDGTAVNQNITTADTEVVQYLDDLCRLGYTITKQQKPDNQASTYALVTPRGEVNPLREGLKELKVLSNKHIPDQYLYADIETRYALLAGFLDADGNYQPPGHFEVVQKSKELLTQIVFLARSLGLVATMYPNPKWVNTDEYWRATIRGDLHLVPTRIARKKALLYSYKNPPHHFRMTITPEGRGAYVGLTVSHDAKFLLGDFTVVHNSSLAAMLMAEMQRQGGVVLLMDTEHGFTAERLKVFGVNPNDILYVEPDHIEGACKVISDTIKFLKLQGEKQDKFLIVWDSVTGTPSKMEAEADYGDIQVASSPRALSASIKKLKDEIARSECYVVMITQTRANIGGPAFGEKQSATGGMALKYYAGARLVLYRDIGAWIKDGPQKIGITVSMMTEKSRMAAPYQKADAQLFFSSGYDRWRSLFDLLVKLNVIEQKGGYYSIDGCPKAFRMNDFQEVIASLEDVTAIREKLIEARVNECTIDYFLG